MNALQLRYLNIKGKFSYHHGTMGSSKSANLLMAAKNYEIQGKKTLVLKPSRDDRWDENKVCSRAGVENREAIVFNKEDNLYDLLLEIIVKDDDLFYSIFIDESQFLSKEQVKQLAELNMYIGIPIAAYGLKNTYKDLELFEGSKALLFMADEIKEIETICFFCNSKATQNLMILNGEPNYIGETEVIGDITNQNESKASYLPVCNKHYYHVSEEELLSIK